MPPAPTPPSRGGSTLNDYDVEHPLYARGPSLIARVARVLLALVTIVLVVVSVALFWTIGTLLNLF